jgi:DNA-binding IclR family transcriptional regulator
MVTAQARKSKPPGAGRRQATTSQVPVRAVQRAFDILGRLGSDGSGATLSELARETALPVSTVARLLTALEHAGCAQRLSDGRYSAGSRVVQIGLSALRKLSVYELAEPHLRRLSGASGETANLAVRADAKQAMYVRQVLSERAIRHASSVGRTLPLDRTAIGAALTGRVGEAGYGARRDAFEHDVTAIAAPIYGLEGEIVAAFSITGPSYRISEADLKRLGRLVVEEARSASVELGGPREGRARRSLRGKRR